MYLPKTLFLTILLALFVVPSPPVYSQDKSKPDNQTEKIKQRIIELLEKANKARQKGDKKAVAELQEEIVKLQKELRVLLKKSSLTRLTREIQRLEKMASFLRALGRTKEAERLYKMIDNLKQSVLPAPQGEQDKKKIAELKQKIFVLTKKALKARENHQYPQAFRYEEEGETLEFYRQILLSKGEKGAARKEQIARLSHNIQRLLDEAVGAQMRGDKKRVLELARQIKVLKAALYRLHQKDKTRVELIWSQFRQVFQKLTKEATSALLKGDKKRYRQIQGQIEALRRQNESSSARDLNQILESMQKNLGPVLEKLKSSRDLGKVEGMKDILKDLERLEKLLKYLPRDQTLPLPKWWKKQGQISPQLKQINRRVERVEGKLDRLEESMKRIEKLLQPRSK